MDFLNMNLPPEENENNKFNKLDGWFDFMNNQMKMEEVQHEIKLNKILTDNDIHYENN